MPLSSKHKKQLPHYKLRAITSVVA